MSRLHRQKLRQVRNARELGAELGVSGVDVTDRTSPAPIVKPTRAKSTKRKAVRK